MRYQRFAYPTYSFVLLWFEFFRWEMMMELNLSATENLSIVRCALYIKSKHTKEITFYACPNRQARRACKILCSASKGGRGFGPQPNKKDKADKGNSPKGKTGVEPQTSKSTSKPYQTIPKESPGVFSPLDKKSSTDIILDREFEERLEAVKRSALEQRKIEKITQFGAIDYDAPVPSEQKTIGLGTKIGVGVAVVVFGLVFALGDFIPSGSFKSTEEEAAVVETKLTDEENLTLQTRLQEYEATLGTSPKDPIALKGAAVTLAELGEYSRAASLLESLSKEKPGDPAVYRLIGEVKYKLKDYDGSVAAYRTSASVSETTNFEVLRGLTNALLAAKKPDEAVQLLLASRERLDAEKSEVREAQPLIVDKPEAEKQKIDPIQIDLLLAKSYSDWGHVSDAVSVYDQLISKHPDDFRGYLAKGIILKENGKVGDAERMFIQARFLAPENAKSLVDRYSRR